MDCSIIYEKEEEKKKKKRKRRRYYKCTNYSTLQAYTSIYVSLVVDHTDQPLHRIHCDEREINRVSNTFYIKFLLPSSCFH